MKLTPHLVIETMDRVREREELFGESLWSGDADLEQARHMLSASVFFDFGTLRPDLEHVNFAIDLYKRGLFKLPYPVTAFRTVVEDKEGLLVMVQHAEHQQLLAGMMVFPFSPDGKGWGGALPAIMIRDEPPNALKPPPPGTRPISLIQYLRDDVCRTLLGDDFLQVMTDGTEAMITECMGCVAMLMSKGVETKHEPAPVKLNKARAAKKKPPINERYIVTIDVNKYTRRTPLDGDHTRGSPRPHWRRGHFRTVMCREGERVIPIAPTLVAVRDDGPVPTPIYQAKG